jgi:outer membrane protein assembly factor BamB
MKLLWKTKVPGNRPLATPAIADGRLFLGGGFGTYEFYAFDLLTGEMVWQCRTKDDGPTAAVVEDGHVVFNTESCELEVLTLEGKPVWKKWLGDPLMSMPAVAAGRIYMAYPDSRGDQQHYLACFDLYSGQEYWKRPIAGEIITAPVVADGQVYLATLEGTVYCFAAQHGELAWTDQTQATSAPSVWKSHCYYSRRQEGTSNEPGDGSPQQYEEMAVRGTARTGSSRGCEGTRRAADYLDYKWRSRSPRSGGSHALDEAVGFGGNMKGSSKIHQAMRNLGKGTVHEVWSHEGAKPFIYQGRMLSAMGDTVLCIDPETDHEFWRKQFRWNEGEHEGRLLDTALTSPALANRKAFVGSVQGKVLCLSTSDGQVLDEAEIGEPVGFQPAVAGGRVYVPGARGGLYCLETGDAQDDGWLMWGGSPAHNGVCQDAEAVPA